MPAIKLLSLFFLLASWSVGNADIISVFVGEQGVRFSHPAVPAKPGDTINFLFGDLGGNHSITQSAGFSTPCLPKEGGFNSGFVLATSEIENAFGRIRWELVINDTEPIWYYCAQGTHCQGGMVGVINANLTPGSNETFLDFSSLARQATTVSAPSTTGGGRLVTGTADLYESSGTLTTTASKTLVSPGSSVTTTSGSTSSVEHTATPPSLTSSTIAGSSTQKASSATLSSTAAVSIVSVAAAPPAAGVAEWGLVRAGIISSCFIRLFIFFA